jgi:hypothetical protein
MITFTYQFYYKDAPAIDGIIDIDATTIINAESTLKHRIKERHPDIPGNWDRYVMIAAEKHKNSYAG